MLNRHYNQAGSIERVEELPSLEAQAFVFSDGSIEQLRQDGLVVQEEQSSENEASSNNQDESFVVRRPETEITEKNEFTNNGTFSGSDDNLSREVAAGIEEAKNFAGSESSEYVPRTQEEQQYFIDAILGPIQAQIKQI